MRGSVMAKLIIYFSLSNNTKKAAQKVQEITGADIYRLEAKNPYPEGYSKYSKVGMKEFEDDIHPEIKEEIPNLEKYDTIYLGYPTWSGKIPMIFHTLFEQYDFTNKKIVPFTTTGGSSASESLPSVKKIAKQAVVTDNFRYQFNDEKLKTFLNDK